MMKKKLILIIIIVFLLSGSGRVVQGVDFSLGIYPPILEFLVKPGSKAKAKVRLFNNGDINLFSVYPVLSQPADEMGGVDIKSDLAIEKDTEGKKFLEFLKVYEGNKQIKEVEIESGKSRDLELVIDVPKKAGNKEYFFTLFFEAKAKGKRKKSSSLAIGRVGINVILTVSDKEEVLIEGEIEEFKAPLIVESGPIPFLVRVRNTGRNHFETEGEIKIFNMFGKEAGRVKILPAVVLPESIRKMTDYESFEEIKKKEEVLGVKAKETNLEKILRRVKDFMKSFSSKEIEKKGGYVIWRSGFLLGRYKARLSLKFDSKGDYSKEIVFWAIPIKLILGIFLGVMVLLLIKKRLTGTR